MKSAWSFFILLSWALLSHAQTELPPKEEFRLLPSSYTVSLRRGQIDSVKLSVLRSRSFKTGKTSISVNEPKASGLKTEIRQLRDRPDEFMLYFSASADAQVGIYTFVPTCTLRNKNKGTVLKLIIQ